MRGLRSKLLAVLLAVTVATTFIPTVPMAYADTDGADGSNVTVSEEDEQEKEQKEEPQVQEEEPEPEPVKEEEPAQAEPQKEESQPAESAADSSSSEQKADSSVSDGSASKSEEKVTLKKSGEDKLSNGTYKAEDFFYSGGTGKVTFTCDKVVIKDGKAYAILSTSSANMTHIYMGSASSDGERTDLYDPETGATGNDVYAFANKKVAVETTLNETNNFSTRTTAMTVAHWITYEYKITLSEDAKKISDSTDISTEGDSTEPVDPEDPEDPEEPTEPSKTTKLKAGTYKAKATTSRDMFYLYPKEKDPGQVILKVKKNGKMTATITLSGEGYDYVYMGSAAKAKKAPKSSWIKAKIVNGYYTFTIPVSKLDKKLTIAPHSKKYASDGDPSTEPWRDGKWIIIYSKGAKKVKDGTSAVPSKKKKKSEKENPTSGTQTKFKNDHKADKESKWKDDSGKSTSAVDNSTSLKDGVYTPDRFSWSGGSGRLAYIKCNKITVKGGKAFATIEFGSTHYDSLKANGRVYSKQGGGNSQFVIPVKLNANNTIIGRTTAMSQPHWVKYTIFVYKAGATGKLGKTAKGDDGHLTSTKKLSDKAPDLMGLKFEGKTKVKYSKLFKIFRYEQGITLISIDQTKGTALYKKESKAKASESDDNNPVVEYDEEGKPIAKTDSERTNDLYQNNVINYLIVPKGVELPAGLEKDCVIMEKPVDSTYIDSKQVKEMLKKMGLEDSLKDISDKAGDYDDIDYKQIVRTKTDLAVLPSEVLPEAVTKDSSKDEKAAAEEKTKEVRTLQTRFSALNVPLLIDRSENEKTNYAQEEWIKVYGAIFGTEDKADQAFDKYVKKHKEKKLEAN